jgi:hypothetical protein
MKDVQKFLFFCSLAEDLMIDISAVAAPKGGS